MTIEKLSLDVEDEFCSILSSSAIGKINELIEQVNFITSTFDEGKKLMYGIPYDFSKYKGIKNDN